MHRVLVVASFAIYAQAGTIQGIDRDITVARDGVVRVYRRPDVSRTMRTLIGGAIGLAAGVVSAQPAGTALSKTVPDLQGFLHGGAPGRHVRRRDRQHLPDVRNS